LDTNKGRGGKVNQGIVKKLEKRYFAQRTGFTTFQKIEGSGRGVEGFIVSAGLPQNVHPTTSQVACLKGNDHKIEQIWQSRKKKGKDAKKPQKKPFRGIRCNKEGGAGGEDSEKGKNGRDEES